MSRTKVTIYREKDYFRVTLEKGEHFQSFKVTDEEMKRDLSDILDRLNTMDEGLAEKYDDVEALKV